MKAGFRNFALAGVLLMLVAFPGAVAAHSEFVSGTPKNGATVQPGPIDIVARFTEPLNSRSHIELLDAAGHLIARGAIDGSTMRIGLEGIDPGKYEVQWTSVAQDGDVLRSSDSPDTRWLFTVAGASPSLTSSPPATTLPSQSATQSAAASPSAVVTPAASPSAPPSNPSGTSTGDVLLPIVAALVVVALLGGLLLRRRTPTAR